jgi:carbonic anhydrase
MRSCIFIFSLCWCMACESGKLKPIALPNDSIQAPITVANHQPAADKILAKLKAGNTNFVNRFSFVNVHSDSSYNYYDQIVNSGNEQHPIACVLTCMDSRVPPEIIFDQGIGNLFVLRVAGNIQDDDILGSIEYAVVEKGVRLIVVMGHTNCGAIAAAFGNVDSSAKELYELIAHVKRAVIPNDKPPYDATAKNNVELTMEDILQHSGTVKRKFDDNELLLAGALYDVSNGKVSWKDSAW